MKDNLFEQLDFGAFQEYIDNDDITDISYTNNGQLWLRSLTQGSIRVENENINNSVVEKLAFQCSNVMGVSFNNANPFLDAESPELRMNFVHDSIATNGIALVIRKTPAKIRLKEETLLEEDYVTKDIHDFLIKCVHGHCNIIVCGETGSGKTEFTKYLASHTVESEKIITIEDTLELHLDKIYPHRDIVAMKTNNIASYSDVLVTCMRQNPKWILLSEVRSAEAVSAVRNSISSGHNILSTIHSDKAHAIPHRMYSLMETDLDVDQFLNTIYRYVQMGVHIKAYYSPKYKKFHREIDEITEFYIDEDNKPVYNIIYQKTMSGKIVKKNPSQHLLDYLAAQNIDIGDTTFEDESSGGLSLEDVIGEKSEEQVLEEQKKKEEERLEQEKKEKESAEVQVQEEKITPETNTVVETPTINNVVNKNPVVPEAIIPTPIQVAPTQVVPQPVVNKVPTPVVSTPVQVPNPTSSMQNTVSQQPTQTIQPQTQPMNNNINVVPQVPTPVIQQPVINEVPVGIVNQAPQGVVGQQPTPTVTPVATQQPTLSSVSVPGQPVQQVQTTMNNGIPIISFTAPNNNPTDGNM